MPRKLRIAASVFFGVVTLVLCTFWVRSYWRWDWLVRDAPQEQRIQSTDGQIQITLRKRTIPGTLRTPWSWESTPQKVLSPNPVATSRLHYPRVTRSILLTVISIPYWTLTLPCLALAVAPIYSLTCCNARFSLRTLLLATTIVALLLGLGTWLAS